VAETLTAIVVGVAGGDALHRCADAVAAQASTVLLACRDGTISDLGGKAVGAAEHCNIPSKRKRAVELAATPVVALIEDTVTPHAGWAEAIAEALESTAVFACGGPVSIDRGLPSSSRALALAEYGAYNDRRRAGPVTALPGCNFAFRRQPLLKALEGAEGLIDQLTFKSLAELGGEIVWAPEMAVTFCRANAEGARLSTRFRHGRIYASSGDRRDPVHRAAAAAKALLLPPVLTLRSLRNAAPAERASLPTLGWLMLQHSAWAAGEVAGAVLGPSAEGLGQWP
jgi:hypothetical protein